MPDSSDEAPELPDGVPEAARDVLAKLAASSPERTAEELRAELRDYLDEVDDQKERYEFLNSGLAEAIAERYLDLLDEYEGLGHEDRKIVRAGLLYFVEPRDADRDFSSIIGFDDDCEVLNAILEHLGRSELIVAPS